MNLACPRCGQNLIVDPRGAATVTCPSCLASISTGATAPTPLAYLSISDDVEAELERDFRWSLYGIVTFAAGSVIGLFFMVPEMDIRVPTPWWFAGVTVVTACVALWLAARHRRRRVETWATGTAGAKSTARRVGGLVALSVAGVLAAGAMVVVSFVVVFILIIIVCGFGGMKI
jgi:hypothetical protein